MQGEWRGTDQDPGGDFVQNLFSQFVSAYLLTVLPPNGEDAHQEGEGGHDYLRHFINIWSFSYPYLPGLGGTKLSVATEHLPED